MLKKYLAFAGILLITFTCFLDYMIVNNALPSIQDSFQVSLLNLQWLVNIYSITLASTLILFGRLGDIIGYRKLFYWGSIFLAFGSLGAGLSYHFGWLLFFRSLQSFGVSIIIVLVPSLIQCIFRDRVNTPMGIYSMMGGVGMLVGPYLGGIIVTYVGWRWIFLINIPVLISGFFVCLFSLKELDQKLHEAKLDWAGSILLLLCMATLIYSLIRQQAIGFDWITITNIVVFLIGLPLLIYVEQRKIDPILIFHFFKRPAFVLAFLANALCGAFVTCGMFFSPIFLQTVLHFSAAKSGTILLTFAISNILFSVFLGQLSKKIPASTIILVSLFLSVFTGAIYALSFSLASVGIAMIAFFLTGVLLAASNALSPMVAAQSVSAKYAGSAIGTVFSMFSIGAGIMLGITTVILHVLTKNNSLLGHLKFSYAMVFICLTVYAFILFLIGLKAYKNLNRSPIV